MTIRTVLALALLAAPLAAQSAPRPIETDRPDFTEASSLVPTGRLQLESGWTMRTLRSGVKVHTLPELLGRFGMSDRLELRAAVTWAKADLGASLGDPDDAGLEDLYLGVKLGLMEQSGSRPQLALMLQTTVATGHDLWSAGEALPGAALLAGWGTDGPWSFAAGLQANKAPGDYLELGPSVAVGRALSSTVRLYGEWFAFEGAFADGPVPAAHYLDGGLAWLLTPDIQVDARVGFGLNDPAEKRFVGVGFSIRP